MRVVIEEGVRQYVPDAALDRVREALEPQTFCDACVIGEFGTQLYIRCPNTRRGVVIESASINAATLVWLVKALELTVEPI